MKLLKSYLFSIVDGHLKTFFGIVASVFCFIFHETHAGEINYKIERISIDQGLSNPTVYTITQDGQGFLWFGAPNGINIYDRYNFRPFRYRGEDVDIGETTNISYLAIDRDRRVWIGTWGEGLYRFPAKAANSDGFWNEAGTTALNAAEPPPWATWWAYSVYGLMVFGLVWAGHKLRIRAIEKRKDELELLVEKRTRQLKETNAAILQRQNQLVIQEKMASLGTLAAGIAHEIKNPLNFVNNFAVTTVELLDEIWRAWKPQRGKIDQRTFAFISELLNSLEQNAGIINKHGRKADAIVQSMMDLARIEPGSQRDTNLNLLVSQYTQLAYHGVKVKDGSVEIAIDFQLDETLPQFRLAPQSMSRAIVNVVNNAIDGVLEKRKTADPAYKPEIKVRTANLGDWVEIRFRDNGIGIPRENLERVLTPFFTTKSPGSGNIGLGLSICFDIVVHEHGGTIKIFSHAGAFTELVIRLPMKGKSLSPKTDSWVS